MPLAQLKRLYRFPASLCLATVDLVSFIRYLASFAWFPRLSRGLMDMFPLFWPTTRSQVFDRTATSTAGMMMWWWTLVIRLVSVHATYFQATPSFRHSFRSSRRNSFLSSSACSRVTPLS